MNKYSCFESRRKTGTNDAFPPDDDITISITAEVQGIASNSYNSSASSNQQCK